MARFSWKNKKVFVTGAGGFIGSHLCERLLELGAEVRAFVHYNSLGRWGWLDNSCKSNEMDIILGDITDRDNVYKAMKGREYIFHLAALIGIPYSYHAPASYVQTNITGTLNLLQAAKDMKVKRFIHTSTSETYGTAQYTPIDEKHPLQGQSPYSATKIGADKIAESFYRSFGLPVVMVRPFNTYGPRQSARAIIPTIVIQALTKKVVHIGLLTPKRDLTFVEDTVSGFICAAMAQESALGQVFNIGFGEALSIKELSTMIFKLIGNTPSIISKKERIRPKNSEVMLLQADITKARKILKWQPRVSLEQGLEKTIAWFKDEKNLEFYQKDRYVI
ncbi:MAG: SDR family NAD(P)-dependent oxidoreductase [Candidatus Omnitrophica bacterium]|nr:SDR family NAD(P)-dependent oxidoreductase [Candidatus Omnitrophota bacterium]MBU2265900.1 SDR family NAD(P)-dependent oxidoreductase [Candidatus Omnitrophota bacterium]